MSVSALLFPPFCSLTKRREGGGGVETKNNRTKSKKGSSRGLESGWNSTVLLLSGRKYIFDVISLERPNTPPFPKFRERNDSIHTHTCRAPAVNTPSDTPLPNLPKVRAASGNRCNAFRNTCSITSHWVPEPHEQGNGVTVANVEFEV